MSFDILLETFIKARFGIVGIVDEDNNLIGIISDKDLREIIKNDFIENPIKKMNTKFFKLSEETLLVEASKFLKEKRIVSCFVFDKNLKHLKGLISVYDVLPLD